MSRQSRDMTRPLRPLPPTAGNPDHHGRRPGALPVRSREIAQKLMNDGQIQPLEVLYANMRFYADHATTLAAQLRDFAQSLRLGIEGRKLTIAEALVISKLIDRVDAARDRAGRAAESAAQFVHARPAAISFDGESGAIIISIEPGLEDL